MKKVLVALLFVSLASFAISEPSEINGPQKPSLSSNRPSAEEIFAKMDVNQDGCISIEEFKEAHQKRVQHGREGRPNHKPEENKQKDNG